jgi:hypothetical protein
MFPARHRAKDSALRPGKEAATGSRHPFRFNIAHPLKSFRGFVIGEDAIVGFDPGVNWIGSIKGRKKVVMSGFARSALFSFRALLHPYCPVALAAKERDPNFPNTYVSCQYGMARFSRAPERSGIWHTNGGRTVPARQFTVERGADGTA